LGATAHSGWSADGGLDGGFVRARHKRGCFEVVAGKNVLEFKGDDREVEKSKKCFGFADL
jgi:hypothetical protein